MQSASESFMRVFDQNDQPISLQSGEIAFSKLEAEQNGLQVGDKVAIRVGEVTEMPHLFDSFFRGSNVGSQQGNGLGLYISRQIMNKMDGEIFAERREDSMCFCAVFRMDS